MLKKKPSISKFGVDTTKTSLKKNRVLGFFFFLPSRTLTSRLLGCRQAGYRLGCSPGFSAASNSCSGILFSLGRTMPASSCINLLRICRSLFHIRIAKSTLPSDRRIYFRFEKMCDLCLLNCSIYIEICSNRRSSRLTASQAAREARIRILLPAVQPT